MTSTPTNRDVLNHLLKNVFGMEDADIELLRNKRVRYYRNLTNMDFSIFDTFLQDGVLFEGTHSDIVLYKKYISYNPLQHHEVMLLTEDIWSAMDPDEINLKYAAFSAVQFLPPTPVPMISPKFPTPATKPSGSTTKPPITILDVKATNFIKYTSLKLNDRNSILTFYKDLYTQGLQYNILVRPEDEIDDTHDVIPDGITPDVRDAISATLYSKFRQDSVIPATFKDAANLLDSTHDGYEFLQLILQLSHPRLMVHSIATMNIPTYNSSKDLFVYAKQIKDFVSRHKLANRLYSDRETTEMYLSHLDSASHKSAIMFCQTQLGTSTTIPEKYKVPAIAGTIKQLMDSTHGTPSPPTTNQPGSTATVNTIQDFDDLSDGFIHAIMDRKSFKGTCNGCGRPNHHAKDCYFVQKLRKALTYLKVDNKWAQNNKRSYERKNTYNKRRNFVRSLQDANFIPFDEDPDAFLDAVEGDDDIFTAELL